MSKFVDIKGKKYNRWTVIEKSKTKNGKTYWLCECECGKRKIVYGTSLRSGKSKSCGCFNKEIVSKQKGLSTTRLYRIYKLVVKRCYDKTDKSYKYYGAKGVTVYNKWLNNFISFYNWSINNDYNDKLTLDRIDVNGNYEPSNCRWISEKEQHYNRTDNIYFTINNEQKCLSQLCEEYNMPYQTVWRRLKKGKDIIEALTTPIDTKKRNKLYKGG